MRVVAHKAGPLKQQNKIHKTGQHSSKRAVARVLSGRVGAKVASRKANRTLNRQQRRNQLALLRKLKRDEVADRKRQIGGLGSPPFIVAIVPAHAAVDPHRFVDQLKGCHSEVQLKDSPRGVLYLNLPHFKKRYALAVCNSEDVYGTMDTVRMADVVVIVYDHEEGYDAEGDVLLSILMAQGMPSALHVTSPLAARDDRLFKKADIKRVLAKQIEDRFPGEKIYCVQNETDAVLLLRQIADVKKRVLKMREQRAYLLAERTDFIATDGTGHQGTLRVTGFLRGGRPLNANHLVHIPGCGDFQIEMIEAPDDPYRIRRREARDDDIEQDPRVLQIADPEKQESLESENPVDEMEAEQTFPTQEELEEAAKEQRTIRKRVPKGTSDYQAAWIFDDEDVGEDDDGDDTDEDAGHSGDDAMESEEEFFDARELKGDSSDEEEEDWVDTASDAMSVVPDEVYDKKIDFDEENEMLKKFRAQREEEQFPDELDTPRDINARTRFQRFRGLKSFHSSPWDPKENLPRDYARIFQFRDFERMRRRLLQISEEDCDGAENGWYVTVHIKDVPRRVAKSRSPLVVFGLFPHEQKMSVLNVAIKRHHTFDLPVKCKERLIFHVGFRRFTNCPIFSQHTMGNKHKLERFLPAEGVCVATMFAPITFPPAPVLVFQETPNGAQRLVATGAVLSADPDRCIVKRVVLSGHPYKINKRHAVIRYMFFNREDILWFKPIELRTKYGLKGHIKEPLGTHGHMKCVFNQHMKSMDTVLMNLYKRVFPKWSFDPYVAPPKFIETNHIKVELHAGDNKDEEMD
ncbi:pre-rRNA-processing protein TSR1-like [Tropilaelaps mercedesae]|uniref:Pre-rRNA-processing protein TSR1 homolog n=1 Tax=Tropilaelaps mercedesae TaxID=418985 RepID=A0A1V9XZT1_9ACAR|nr:pre-rRNA-processing protein TSR1-like [Tropilaelaps mercedesae]